MTIANEDRTVDWNPFDPSALADPHEAFKDARSRCPVPYSDQLGGFWSLLRHDDIAAACKDHTTFSSEPQFSVPALDIGFPWLPIQVDPPRHEAYRAVLRPYLTRTRTSELMPAMRELAREILHGFAGRESIDAATEFAHVYAARTLCLALDLPADHWRTFRQWAYDITHASSTNDMALFGSVVEQVFEYVDAEAAARTAAPGDDLMSSLLATEIDGRPPTIAELRGYYLLLITAGHDTSANTLGSVVFHLAQHPDHRARLRSSPDLVPLAVEEIVRFYPPLVALGRQVAADTERFGCPMKRGDQVALVWASATRDEAHFADADEFVIDRRPNAHIGFGHGVHHCVGADLARVQLRVAMEELLSAFPYFHISGPIVRTVWPTNGYRSLPITFGPGPSGPVAS